MKFKHIALTLARLFAILILLAGTGCGAKPAANPTAVSADTAVPPTATATAIPPTNTPEPTNTPLPTATATQTPLPTATSTPVPTATPDGLTRDANHGLSLILPRGWAVREQTKERTVVANRDGSLILIFSSVLESEPSSIDDIAAQFKKDNRYAFKTKSKIEIAGGSIEADVIEMNYTEGGQKFDFWFVYAHNGARGYMTWVMAKLNSLKERREDVAEVLDTLEFFRPTLYDLPYEDTFTELGSDPLAEQLDPATATGSAAAYVGLLFAGLVRLDSSLAVEPDLAESWEISEDGTVYTFTLREGIKFVSDDPITAEDVRKSWERALDPATKSTTAVTYLGDILGAKDKLDGKASEVSGIKVIDDRTLEVTLDGPKAYFLAKLTYPTSYVVDTRQPKVNEKDWMFAPNASGPYKIKEYMEEEAIIFERSDAYHQAAKTRYLLFIFQPGGSPISLYEEGTLDVLPLGYEEQAEISKPDNPHNKDLVVAPSMCTMMISLNPNLPPTDDPLVRKAIYHATDTRQWIDKINSGQSVAASGILPPAMPGYQSRTLPAFDEAAAREALSQSTYSGKPLNIVISSSGYPDRERPDLALLVDQWQKTLGAKVTVDIVDPVKWSEAVRKDPGNVVISGWCADYPDPENFLDVLFHTGSNFNYTNISDPELDAILEKARVALDPAERLKLYSQAEERILTQYYAIPINHSTEAVLINPRIKGYTVTAIGIRFLDRISLEKK